MLRIPGARFQLVDPHLQGAGFLHDGRGVLAGLLQACDLFTELVAPGLQLFGLGNALAAHLVQLAKIAQQSGGVLPAIAQLLLYKFKIGTNKAQIEHT